MELECFPPYCTFYEQEDKGTEELQHTPKEHFNEDREKCLWVLALSAGPSYSPLQLILTVFSYTYFCL